MSDHEIITLNRKDRLEIIRDKIRQNIHEAYNKSAKRYNERARVAKFIPGQEVFRRNFAQSDFKNNVNAKFCRKFLKSRIVGPIGNNMFELEDLKGNPVGIFHVKDIKI